MTSLIPDRTPIPMGSPVGAVFGPGRDEFPAAIPALPPGTATPPLPRCHRCGTLATTQWKRQATPAEAEQHWSALEQHIRSIPDLFGHGSAEYTADHTQTVTKAVHGCDDHQVPGLATLHAADCGGHQACQCEGATADG